MILEIYLKQHNVNLHQMHLISGIPETTIRSIDKREFDKWNIEYFDAVAKAVNKKRFTVIKELERLQSKLKVQSTSFDLKSCGKYDLENRRYIGNKNKLLGWISKLMSQYTSGDSLFDVFAGTGVVSKRLSSRYHKLIINDFLFSNNIIYKAFFDQMDYDINKLMKLRNEFQLISTDFVDDDYFSNNFGGKFFSKYDAKIIGEIRTRIKNESNINEKERAILIASLLYSADKIANTVGHYDAYRKGIYLKNRFRFELIKPINLKNKEIRIYREDANKLVRKILADIAFIDPPYNSRQYSRFYHVLENITKWDKPKLEGVAMKPPTENISEYSKVNAPKFFDDLIQNLHVKYIVVTYNNTYRSKSSSSKNKITHEQILASLNKVGVTKYFEMPFPFFNAGKTSLQEHKEFVFITKVIK